MLQRSPPTRPLVDRAAYQLLRVAAVRTKPPNNFTGQTAALEFNPVQLLALFHKPVAVLSLQV